MCEAAVLICSNKACDMKKYCTTVTNHNGVIVAVTYIHKLVTIIA